jgi:phosphoglycerate dehydrogenase-like enzyme
VKALFLGEFSASAAPLVIEKLGTPLATEILADHRDGARLGPALAEAEIVVANVWRRDFPPAPRMRLLQSVSAGIDAIDVAALPPGVTVCNVFGHEPPIAEYAVMAMLVWFHRLVEIAAEFRAGSWRSSGVQEGPPHRELFGRTVGIVGMGRIGREIARRAAAFDCRVIAANRSPLVPPEGVAQIYPLSALDEMLPLCDVVILCCGLGPETRGLFDARRLALMRRSSYLINVGRGPIADEDALYAALRDGTIGGAAIDVWWHYPTAADPARRPSRHNFHDLPNVLMTPHCSGWTDAMLERRWSAVAANLDRFARGESLENVVARS